MLEVNKGIFRPQDAPHLLTRNDSTVGFQKQAQQLKWLFLNTDGDAGSSQVTAAQIDFVMTEASPHRTGTRGSHPKPR
jgi:hypothetical protein